MSKNKTSSTVSTGSRGDYRGIPMPSSEKYVSEEERVQILSCVRRDYGPAGRCFHTASNVQVEAVARLITGSKLVCLYAMAALSCMQALNNRSAQPYDFQGQYGEDTGHERAYVASFEGLDVLSMAQSRSWQANGLREQGRYLETLQTIEGSNATHFNAKEYRKHPAPGPSSGFWCRDGSFFR